MLIRNRFYEKLSELPNPSGYFSLCSEAEKNFTALLLAQHVEKIQPVLVEILTFTPHVGILALAKPNAGWRPVQGESNYLIIGATDPKYSGWLAGLSYNSSVIGVRQFDLARADKINELERSQRVWARKKKSQIESLSQLFPMQPLALALLSLLADELRTCDKYSQYNLYQYPHSSVVSN